MALLGSAMGTGPVHANRAACERALLNEGVAAFARRQVRQAGDMGHPETR